MPVLTRLIPSPLVVDIRRGRPRRPGGLLADQRISHSGQARRRGQRRLGRQAARRLAPALPGAELVRVGGGTIDAAVPLGDDIKAGPYDAVVGLGGGKIIDCAKYAAARVGLPLVAVATNLAHDGLCSPVATLDNDAGRGSFGVPIPIAVVIDLDVIREAPARFVRSGIGDAMSNISAIADWELARRVDGRDDRRPRRRDGPPGRRGGAAAPRRHRRRRASSGAGRGAWSSPASRCRSPGDSRPSSGACHEILHAFDLLYPARRQPRRAVRPRRGLRDVPARGARGVGVHGRGAAPARAARAAEEIGFTDRRVRHRRSSTRRRPAPAATRSWSTSAFRPKIRDAYADYVKSHR